jgi:hypothetical protein
MARKRRSRPGLKKKSATPVDNNITNAGEEEEVSISTLDNAKQPTGETKSRGENKYVASGEEEEDRRRWDEKEKRAFGPEEEDWHAVTRWYLQPR